MLNRCSPHPSTAPMPLPVILPLPLPVVTLVAGPARLFRRPLVPARGHGGRLPHGLDRRAPRPRRPQAAHQGECLMRLNSSRQQPSVDRARAAAPFSFSCLSSRAASPVAFEKIRCLIHWLKKKNAIFAKWGSLLLLFRSNPLHWEGGNGGHPFCTPRCSRISFGVNTTHYPLAPFWWQLFSPPSSLGGTESKQ